LFISKFTVRSQKVRNGNLDLQEIAKPVYYTVFLQLFLLSKLFHRDLWCKEIAGFLGNFAFCTNKYLNGQCCKQSWQELPWGKF